MKHDVIVVGAGVAGLSAAQQLRRLGKDVLVVEARNRLGGRTWTRDIEGATVDLGGAWLHGPDGNPLAGEHTVARYYGTVHAAFLSGRRAAEQVAGGFSYCPGFLRS